MCIAEETNVHCLPPKSSSFSVTSQKKGPALQSLHSHWERHAIKEINRINYSVVTSMRIWNRPTLPLPFSLLFHSGTIQSSNWMGQMGQSEEGRGIRQWSLSSEPVKAKDTCSARKIHRRKGMEGSKIHVSHCWKESFN